MKTINITPLFIILLLSLLSADVKSVREEIKFDLLNDDTEEMTLNTIGLGVGIIPSANLHIAGNAVVSESFSLGTTTAKSNFEVKGTVGDVIQLCSTNTMLSGNSTVFVNSSQGNVTIELPDASIMEGRKYTIKKISMGYDVKLTGGPFDNLDHIILDSSEKLRPSVTLQSFSGNWFVMNMSGNTSGLASDNLVLWHKFSETNGVVVNDFSGAGNTGTLTNSSFSTNTTDGISGNGLTFDGIDDHVNLGNNFSYSDNYTVSTWIKTTATTGRIASKRGGGGTGFDFYLNSGGRIYYYDNTAGQKDSGYFVNDGTWHHISFAINGANSYMYVDGNRSTAFTPALSVTSADFYIGRYGGSYISADMDDFRVYNKALDQTEISGLFELGLLN